MLDITLKIPSLNLSLRSSREKSVSLHASEENNGRVRSDRARQGNDGGGSTHISASRIISANCRKINKRNITLAAGSTELGTGHGIGWGKRDRNAQALLETLTAAEGLGSSAIRPLKEVREKEERNLARGEKGGRTTQAGIVGGMESCRMREASLMKYGLLAEELACVPRCWYGWRSARRRNEF